MFHVLFMEDSSTRLLWVCLITIGDNGARTTAQPSDPAEVKTNKGI